MKCETSDATLKQYIKKSLDNSEDEGVAEVTDYLCYYFPPCIYENITCF